MTDKTLRLILGDQLNAAHSWFKTKDDHVTYLIAELHQEASYVKHHVQKLVGFFAAMHAFAKALETAGHRVIYLTLDETGNDADLPALIARLCEEQNVARFEYQYPDEYRLRKQLADTRLDGVEVNVCDSEHFLLPADEVEDYFEKDQGSRMETFYRKMRQRFDILMDGDEPVGGQWNYDEDNRNKLKKSDLEDIPTPLVFANPVTEVKERIDRHELNYFGEIGEELVWPITRKQSRELLDYFCEACLPRFGKFQDAMTDQSEHAWSLYHSRLSFAMNTKMLSPMEIVSRAVEEHNSRPEEINLAQIEGFVRQIIGWREFIRGIYWINMPDYAEKNALDAGRSLPGYFWTGDTKMNCMKQSLGQSLEHAYAHHIQRLMVIGNFCLLAGIDPDEVDAWYLGVYIDAIEWVEMPNTRGMCQFADGGLVASKPYTASGAYINRMSDYCKSCHYKVKEKVGDDACPFNSLYWHFMDRHKDRFGNNPRIGMVYRNWERMDDELKEDTLEQAEKILGNLDNL